jgi:hypothetical protein
MCAELHMSNLQFMGEIGQSAGEGKKKKKTEIIGPWN